MQGNGIIDRFVIGDLSVREDVRGVPRLENGVVFLFTSTGLAGECLEGIGGVSTASGWPGLTVSRMAVVPVRGATCS
jgi:hypothetical protein